MEILVKNPVYVIKKETTYMKNTHNIEIKNHMKITQRTHNYNQPEQFYESPTEGIRVVDTVLGNFWGVDVDFLPKIMESDPCPK